MKFSYKFSNLIGTVYRKGNLLFSPDGNSVISPVGNKITIFDLKNNKTNTLPIESRFNFVSLDICPKGSLLIAINEEGEALLISLSTKTVLHRYRFKRPVPAVRFSPDGKYIAVCKECNVFIFKSPGLHLGTYNPFEMIRIFKYAHDETTCLDWTTDGKVLAVGSRDMAVKLYAIDKFKNFRSYSLGGHKGPIVACFFYKDSLDVTTISSNGQVCVWECNIDLESLCPDEEQKRAKLSNDDSEDVLPISNLTNEGNLEDTEIPVSYKDAVDEEEEKLCYKRVSRHFLCDDLKKENPNVILTSADYHKDTHILVTGYSSGSFFIHELPSVNLIHSLSISEHQISSISLNNTGDWIALASSNLGQLLVWEWQSETYVMKQQGHMNNMTCLAYSPDGMYLCTGGHDAKIKLWNTNTGFCIVTFTEHTSAITGIQFSNNRKFVVSSSLDGTVRAFDLTRYRNFKTFTSPKPVQFSCVALDANGEFVAAGGQDVFEIYIWSMKIGRLCEVLAGHEGPVSSICFNPMPGSSSFISGSWDQTARLWNAIERGTDHEILQLNAYVLSVAYRPDGEEVAVATLDGQIAFFSTKYSQQTGCIEGNMKDLGGSVTDTDLISARKNLAAKAFSSICYTADGSCVLAGGQSKNVCIYNVKETMLLKKFEITQNRSLDGLDDFINRRKMSEWGNLALVEDHRIEEQSSLRLPGVKKGDMSSRSFKPEVRVLGLEFSPTGQAWAAVTTEGLLVYSLDLGLIFDPFQLDISITPQSIKETLNKEDFSKSLMMAIKLGEKPLIIHVIERTPPDCIPLCVASLPETYATRCLKAIVSGLENSQHLEFYLLWTRHMLTTHGKNLCGPDSMPVLLALQKNITRSYDELSKLCDFNKYTMQFLTRIGRLKLSEMDIDEDHEDLMSD